MLRIVEDIEYIEMQIKQSDGEKLWGSKKTRLLAILQGNFMSNYSLSNC